MKKKKIIIIILVILILFGIYMLYNTFAVSTIASNNDSNNTYDILVGEGTTITVPKGSSKTIYFHLKNTNNGSVKYALGYNTTANIEVKVYEDSKDKVSDIIGYTENKYIKLYLKNPTNNSNTVTITSVLGYENGGDLIVPDGITLITEKYFTPIALSEHITNLYTNASKSPVENNGIDYNYASSVSLMNDRLGKATTDLDGGNIRYYGASPNNYIYFNCSDYNNQSDTTCEKWRIIGVFDGKVKIMRNSTIGTYSWDTSASGVNKGYGVNEWSQADLMKLLNPGYSSESVGGSLYYNSEKGTCYNNYNNSSTSCDFTSSGIKNDETKNKIAEVTWNLGGWNDNEIYSNQIYGYERGTKVVSNPSDGITRATTWKGKVALPYPSDYGYAADFNSCSKDLYEYKDGSCTSNNWMKSILGTSSDGCFLTPDSGYETGVWYVDSSGYVITLNYSFITTGVAPTLYLNANEYVESGNGTESNPYHLMKDSPVETASKYITNLYTNATKTTVENNSITYNYASSVSLMNDRLGGTTSSLAGGNIRYYGASPNNYIYFNCSDYNNQTSDTCELWRIIGVFDSKVKIIRNESIGAYSWDTSASGLYSGQGVNEWPQADLMKLLNPGYENETVGGSLYYNSSSGTCYSGQSNTTKSCDFTSSGIKNYETKNKIAEVTWNLGGWQTNNVFSNEIYIHERGTTVYSGRSTTWPGKVALPYPSDYGYATDFNECTQKLYYYDSSSRSYACRTNDWMYPIITGSGNSQGWLLTHYSPTSYVAWYLKSSGSPYYKYGNHGDGACNAYGVAPVLYLSADESIVEGTTGTESNPFKLNP